MPLLVALFILVPLAELFVIIQVGGLIGPGWTILILLADSVAGALLLKHQGRAAWRRFNETMAAGRVPHREVIDGAMIVFGAALLLTPGFITDVVGILFLLPPTRDMLRRVFAAIAVKRNAYARAAWAGSKVAGGFRRRHATGGPVRPAAGGAGAGGFASPGAGAGGFGATAAGPPPHRPYDVEGTAEPVEDEELPAGPAEP